MDYHDIISNKSFFFFLLKIDQDICTLMKIKGCIFCGDKLDQSDFFRSSGFGIPKDCESECLRRHSLCCRKDGCRKRLTTPSVRFLPYKCYLTTIIILISTMSNGINGKRLLSLKAQLGVHRETLRKWQTWWQETFCQSPYWKVQKGRFQGIDDKGMPSTLLEQFKKNHDNLEHVFILCLATIGFYTYGDAPHLFKLIQGLLKESPFPQT